ncbi:EAL and HDOD domain-containing protein [Fundidesulfovibrio soli]|uniref:EAL and HDOD domain-containing protein n=1 Tax=Fundidesulfovibrio soli TaxID=2922716 RepID=UPI001FAF5094|nr:HDOD domain-containing protein [Fundidesulfovibrio soli]
MLQQDQSESAACFLSRHPVFDRDKTISAHEVVARSCLHPGTPAHSDVQAFSWLVTDGASELQSLLEECNRLLINVPDPMLDAPEVHLLPMDLCDLVVSPEHCTRSNLSEVLEFLQDYGYSIALRFEGGCGQHEHLLRYASMVILDLKLLSPMQLAKERKFLKKFPLKLMVSGIGTWEAFAGSKALAFDYFSGTFFGRPEIVKGRKLSVNSLTRMELISALLKEDSTFAELAAPIAKDAFLSYRLLRYVNSPGMGLGRTVSSIEHAVAILGDTSFKHWAMMALVSSLDSTPKGEELGYLSLQRGAFLEKIAARAASSPLPPRSMFLLGLFSLLDAMLDQPMEELVGTMPMDPRIKAALTGERNMLAPWLDLLECVDQNQFCDVTAILEGQKVNRFGAARDYLEAARWARHCFRAGKDGEDEAQEQAGA